MKPFSKARAAAVASAVIALAFVLAVAALFVCAFCGLGEDNAAVLSLAVFAAVSAMAFLYLIFAPPKEEKLMRIIGFAGLMFDIMAVPAIAVVRLLTGN